jgi:AAA domain
MDDQKGLQPGRGVRSRRGERGMELYSGMVALSSFFQTVVYREFESFCEHCRRAGSMGVVYGAAGVGKTLAVCGYTQWDRIQPLLTHQGIVLPAVAPLGLSLRGALYTIERRIRPKQLENDITLLQWSMQNLAKTLLQQEEGIQTDFFSGNSWQLLFLDNVQYLDAYLLDVVQDLYDRYRIGVILLGPPSLVEGHALNRHPHLRTRIGRYYGFRLLSQAEIASFVMHFVTDLKVQVSLSSEGGMEWLMEKVHLMTLGNVSLVCLLLDQVGEVLQKEKVPFLTEAVLQKAYHRLRWT